MFGLAGSVFNSFLIGWHYQRTERFHMKIHHPDFSKQSWAIWPPSHLATRVGLPPPPTVSAFALSFPTGPAHPHWPSHPRPPHAFLELDGAGIGVWDAHSALSTVAQRQSLSPWKGLLYFCSALASSLCLPIKLPCVHSLNGETEA